MNGLDVKVAGSLLAKPATGFIEAILGPKIENIKQWAKENELKGQLDSSKLQKLFDKYLRRVYGHTSVITSIAFPQLKLPI